MFIKEIHCDPPLCIVGFEKTEYKKYLKQLKLNIFKKTQNIDYEKYSFGGYYTIYEFKDNSTNLIKILDINFAQFLKALID